MRGRLPPPRQASAASTDVGCVLFDRRDPAFWQRKAPSIVPRDPYFAIDLDTGNS